MAEWHLPSSLIISLTASVHEQSMDQTYF